MLKTVRISFNDGGFYYVDLPSYNIVNHSWGPVTPGVITSDGPTAQATEKQVMTLNPYVQVEIPDYTPIRSDGQFDRIGINAMYKEHPKYSMRTWTPPIALA